MPNYVEFIGKEIQTSYLESYSEYGQNIFDRYVTYADFWIQDQEYRDPETGENFGRASLNEELEKIEKPAGISNPKDFRNEVVNFVLRARAMNEGNNPGVGQLRKAAHGDREEDVLQHRGPVAGHFVQRQGVRGRRKETCQLRLAHGRKRLYREAGAPALRMVPARAEGVLRLSAERIIDMAQLIDRRPNAKNKSTVNRQRFLRRYKKQIKEAISEQISKRSITDIDGGESVSIPTRDISEPTFRNDRGGVQEGVYPGNKEFAPGDRIKRPKPEAPAGRAGAPATQGEGEDEFSFEISQDEYLDLYCSTTWNYPT